LLIKLIKQQFSRNFNLIFMNMETGHGVSYQELALFKVINRSLDIQYLPYRTLRFLDFRFQWFRFAKDATKKNNWSVRYGTDRETNLDCSWKFNFYVFLNYLWWKLLLSSNDLQATFFIDQESTGWDCFRKNYSKR
jgi:hypothetical protein